MRPLRTSLIALPVAALAIAGCGGGGSGDSTASAPATTTEAAPAVSKFALISKGDAICAEVNAAVGSVGASSSEPASQVVQVSDLYINLVDDIKNLGTPEDSADYSEFIAAAEALSKAEGEAKLAAERGDSAALGAAAEKAAPALEEFEATAGSYGFEQCGEGPSAPASTAPSGEAEEGGIEATPEAGEEAEVEEVAPEEVAPETGGAGGGGIEEPRSEGEGGGSGSGGVGPG